MLTIGEFSRLSRVSPRMLRHYDALGLLHPDTVGENGYRYYRQEQLSDLVRIQWLSGYGFALHEIGPLLGLEDGALLSRLHQRREALRRAKEQLMARQGLSEPEAYQAVSREAKARGLSLEEAARALLEGGAP